jgi:PAS domain S-box-containing protein
MADDGRLTEPRAGSTIPFQDIVESSRIIAETASDAIITIDEHSTILFVNPAASRIFGYSMEELQGKELTILMPEYLRHLHRQGLHNYVETGARHISWDSVELPGLHKNGREISLELSFGEYQKDGQRFFTGIARDITRRKQDERRLALQHSVSAILAEATSVDEATPKLLGAIGTVLGWQVAALWTVDVEQDHLRCIANWRQQSSLDLTEFETVSCNSRFGRDEGLPGKVWVSREPLWVDDFINEAYPRSGVAARGPLHTALAFPILIGAEVLGVIELFSEEARQSDSSLLNTFAAIGNQIGQFIERKKGEAERSEALAREYAARREAESLTKRLAAVQRMTDAALARLTVDEVLSESLDRIREVLNVDTVAILLLRTEGDELVAWAAKGLEEEVHLGVRIPVGKGFAGRVVQQATPIIIEDVSKADVFNPLLREKGIKSLLGVPLLIEGRPIGVLHVGKLEFTQFTNDDVQLLQLAGDRIALAIENARLYQVERKARAEAEDANRAKDEFLTVLSHELRTPLTPIIGWIHMMESGILPKAEFGKGLSVINRNAYGLKRLINDLLDMSAILSGKMQIEKTNLLLAGVLAESVDTMRSYARDSKVHLTLETAVEAEEAIVTGDRTRLNQTFCNVLQNAIKFSPPGGLVNINFHVTPSEASVSISDQGEGIEPDFLPHVFERFRQADGSRTRTYGGLGLGLALVKSFVEAHGGSVAAASEGEGQGSVFVIKLPRAPVAQEQTSKPKRKPEPDARKKSIRVLIVEDQPDTLEMLDAGFQSRGYETILCDSALEAMRIADRDVFDILISDIAMPAMDGLRLIADLRQKAGLETIPAIALTGYASQNDAETAIAAGFDMHLSKPIDPAELVAAVERLLDSRSNQKS